MRFFHFSENPHPPAYDNETGNLRSILPRKHYDAARGHDLLNRYYDDWVLADELGLNIMSNEQYSTATCGTVSSLMALAILARQTKNAQLLSLGVPIGAHPDPVKVAEQIAWVDVLSAGRLEVGLVKGGAPLYMNTNVNPATSDGRFKDAYALIIKALGTNDGPFSWESEHFSYRNVNIWPSNFNDTPPPIWQSALGPFGGKQAAEMGASVATTISASATRVTYKFYRDRQEELGMLHNPTQLGHMIYVSIADTRKKAEEKARTLLTDYYYRGQAAVQLDSAPGMKHFTARAKSIKYGGNRIGGRFVPNRDGENVDIFEAPLEELVKTGLLFAGTPEDIIEQIEEFEDYVGPFGNLMAGMHGGTLGVEETRESMHLLAEQVVPHFKDRHV